MDAIQDEFYCTRTDVLIWGQYEALSEVCHNGVGWLWDGTRLRCKSASTLPRDNPDGVSHYALFGNDLYYAKARGWYNSARHTCTLQTRSNSERIASADMMPDRLYRALTLRFGIDVRFLVI